MDNKRSAFTIYISFCKTIPFLTDEQAGKLFKAICKYVDSREETDFTGDLFLQAEFAQFKDAEDVNLAKWIKKRTDGKEAAEKQHGKQQGLKDEQDPGLPFK